MKERNVDDGQIININRWGFSLPSWLVNVWNVLLPNCPSMVNLQHEWTPHRPQRWHPFLQLHQVCGDGADGGFEAGAAWCQLSHQSHSESDFASLHSGSSLDVSYFWIVCLQSISPGVVQTEFAPRLYMKNPEKAASSYTKIKVATTSLWHISLWNVYNIWENLKRYFFFSYLLLAVGGNWHCKFSGVRPEHSSTCAGMLLSHSAPTFWNFCWFIEVDVQCSFLMLRYWAQ